MQNQFFVWMIIIFICLISTVKLRYSYIFCNWNYDKLFKFVTHLKLSYYEPILSNKQIDRIILIMNRCEPFSQTQRTLLFCSIQTCSSPSLKSAYVHTHTPSQGQHNNSISNIIHLRNVFFSHPFYWMHIVDAKYLNFFFDSILLD